MNDTRFEVIFNEIRKLREDMNISFELIRDEMNKRFEQVDKRFEQVDKRFEQVDKRFEQVDKQIALVGKRIDFNQQLILFLLT